MVLAFLCVVLLATWQWWLNRKLRTCPIRRYRRVIFEVVEDQGDYQRYSYLWKIDGAVYKLLREVFDKDTFSTTNKMETTTSRSTILLYEDGNTLRNRLRRKETFSLSTIRRFLPTVAFDQWYRVDEKEAKNDLLKKAEAMAKAGRRIRVGG